ncbi:MAG TPA: hypothetical protein VGR22_12470 [Thermomicrobiales bacterium]|nr:hypothetical protein [Thermomicrobiales bacterium]
MKFMDATQDQSFMASCQLGAATIADGFDGELLIMETGGQFR